MSDELLPYYNGELAYLRRMGAEFAEANPKIASRLRWGDDLAEDPHVARMIEAFAYLTARIRHKLDDDFPELTQALLGILYPHYLAPIPSMSIAQFKLDRSQGDLTTGYHIPRGANLETEPVRGKGVEGESCVFRTCYETTLWPLEITAAELKGHPFAAPPTRLAPEAKAIVRIQLRRFADQVSFQELAPGSLRFYLHGPSQYVYELYELLLNNALGVAVAKSTTDPGAVLLPRSCIRPVGFAREEGMLPYPVRSFLGYRLLSEFFSFPQKFLFFELQGLDAAALRRIEGSLELFVFLNRHVPALERNVETETFQLGCTPIVNLYQQRAEPIRLTHAEHRYRVIPDARRPLAHEIHAVDRVVATSPENEQVEFHPFYSVRHAVDARRHRAFWHATRERAGLAAGQVDHGTEVYLTFVDLDFLPSAPAKWTLDVETTCLNRDLPRHLPFGGGQPRLQLSAGAPLQGITLLTPPTPTRRPHLGRGTAWHLISHLSLNHLSLLDSESGADALREILRLYNFSQSAETQAMIEGVLSIGGRRVVGRVGGSVAAGFCRGFEVTVHFDEERFSGSGVYLFAAVLERFFGLYTSINSFSKLVATTNKREEALCRWPPRAGEQVLL
jgi:type VI secretion system protein ImpG